MNIIIVRSLKGYPDSRVEKEIFSLSKENKLFLFGWNRYFNADKITSESVDIFGKQVNYYHYNHIAPIGLGFKKLLLPLLRYWIAEYRFLKNNINKFDAIHACDFDTVLPALLISKKFNKKIVYDIFDYYADSHTAPKLVKIIIRKIENWVIGKCDATIICSEKRKEQICGSNPKLLEIVHNTPIKFDSINKEKFSVDKTKCNLVYVGVLTEGRYLKEIANEISNRSDIVLHIGGWGPLSVYFKELSKKHSNIKFYGEIPYSSVLKLESACDIMTALYDPIVPNHKFAAPNKFYESVMLGKPLIMIKNTGMDCYVSKEQLGEVIDLSKTDFQSGFRSAINHLIDNRCNWNEICERAKKLYDSNFSWDQMELRLLNLYRKI